MKVLSFIRKMVGASAGADGRSGYVPKPLAGQHGYFLRGDATYQNIPGGGDMLAANNLAEINTPAKRAAARVNLDVASNSEDLARLWSMAGYVKFDAATVGQQVASFIPGLNIGTGDFSVSWVGRIPATDPTTNGGLWGIGAASTFNQRGGLALYLATSGNLQLGLCAADSSNTRNLYFVDFVTAYAGQWVRITVTRIAGTIAIYANKTDITASLAEVTFGTPPGSMAETVSGQYVAVGRASSTDLFGEEVSSIDLFNYGLTAAQVAELFDAGLTVANRWASTFGMNAIANQERNARFSGTASDWSAVATGTPAIDTTNDELDVTCAAAQDGAQLASTYLAQLKAGSLYRLTFTITNFTTLTGVEARWNGASIGTATGNGVWTFEFTPTAGIGALEFLGNASGSFSVSDITLERILLPNGNFETAAGDDFGSWSEAEPGTATVEADAVVFHSGTKSAKLTYTAGNTPYMQQLVLTPGVRYRASAWMRHNKGSSLPHFVFFGAEPTSGGSTIVSADYLGNPINLPTDTWTHVIWDFTAKRPNFGLVASGTVGDGNSFWWDGVTVKPIGSVVSLSPWGLDKDTTLWRNQALNGDATISGAPQVVTGAGRSHNEENVLTQISREHRALAGGGVFFDGNASQRVNVNLLTAQDIDTAAFWMRIRFKVPTSNPVASRLLGVITTNSSGNEAGNGASLQVTTTGNLNLRFTGATTSDVRVCSAFDFVSRYGGRVVNAVLCRTAGGGLLVWINAVPFACLESVSGTPPTWALDIASTYIFAPVTHIGEVFTWQLGRGTLTDALVAELMSTGIRAEAGSPISKGGTFSGVTDGVVIDLDFSVGAGQQFPDRSGNNFHGNSNHTSHMHLEPKRQFQVRGRVATNVTTQLNGAKCLPANARISSIVIKCASGTPTVDIGNAASGEQMVKDWVLATGRNEASADGASGRALVSRFSSTENLYITSSTSDQLDITINAELAD